MRKTVPISSKFHSELHSAYPPIPHWKFWFHKGSIHLDVAVSGKKVLLTGGSGFVGSHCLDLLLQEGYEVVATVRSEKKGQDILSAFPAAKSQLSYAIVEDIAWDNAFDEAVRTAEFGTVLHVASPYHYKLLDIQKDLIDPVVNGTLNILKAVSDHAPTAKRVIITSSFSAVVNIKHPEKTYQEHHFNPITREEAYEDGVQAYRASKTFAELAAWEFMQIKKPGFSLTTMNPPLILGPLAPWLASMDSINTSNERLRDLCQEKWKDELPPTASWYWVDVRDVARAHVRALEKLDAGGRRFFLMQGRMSNAQIAQVAADEYPRLKDKIPKTLVDDTPPDLREVDAAPSTDILGLEYRDMRTCIVDSLKLLIN
ncbi:methylglyoxal reductase (NADPH-dependent) gre2 [Fusarium oxysporum]|nr:methylglyoxal reductase (NADPH-dependent) gre2 [Fusarium oxysporum]KAJ4048461.1 methylglyoxal reductase (NADPH-dependent) gre2 [Fusarium oxysporum]KAJ4076679.1 methylglyoxal reductase (NADPH-dependent) gre2 [Fusarium oxysporum]